MQFLKDFWAWLDGKKTTFGAIILFIATFFSSVIVGIWHVEGTWVQPIIDTLNWVGMAVTGIGLGFKAAK